MRLSVCKPKIPFPLPSQTPSDLLRTRCLHASPLTIALHVGHSIYDVVCREYVGSNANDAGRRKKEGRNGFDEHQNIKQNEGTGNPKPQQSRDNNTKSPKQPCRPFFCIVAYRDASEGMHHVQRMKLQTSNFGVQLFN